MQRVSHAHKDPTYIKTLETLLSPYTGYVSSLR